MTAPALHATSDRVLAAATELFARRGFHGASMRAIARQAGANLASGHYHYGSKDQLYLEVLRGEFARVRATLERRGVRRTPAALRNAGRAELARLLEARVLTILDVLLGPPPSPTAALMQREMADPSRALPMIVAEFIRPQLEEMEALLSALAPQLSRDTRRWAAFSIFGQILFYRFNLPSVLLILGRPRYPRGFNRRMARHITTFSLAGLEALARPRRRRGR